MAMPQGGIWNSDPRKVLTIKNKLEIIKHKIRIVYCQKTQCAEKYHVRHLVKGD